MLRSISPELLDSLPPADPAARKSRRDLQKINTVMGHFSLFVRWLLRERQEFSRLVEIGAGDGRFAFKLARMLAPHVGPRQIVLVDGLSLVDAQTRVEFQKIGWSLEVVVADALDWLASTKAQPKTAMLANLFLHHFTESQLREIFGQAVRQCRLFCACEPRRSRWARVACKLLPLLGCHSVTLHDAPISVVAGFKNAELSSLWPQRNGWNLLEKRAGLFSHVFLARQQDRQ